MPGTVVRDALETDLLSGLTLTGTGTVTGTASEVLWPCEVTFLAETGTVTGTTPTMEIIIQGCETSDFSTAAVVELGTIHLADDDDASISFTTKVDAKYVRAVATKAGTSPVYTGTTVKIVQPHYHRQRGVSPTAAALA
jgi:hypothetical protein